MSWETGVRQGDPLSPLLFVLAADLLQYIVNKAHTQGICLLPIETDPSSKFPIIQYGHHLNHESFSKRDLLPKGTSSIFC